MQYIAAGAAAVADFVFLKNGAPTTPANAPTITAAYYNRTLLTPLPGIGSPVNPGEYTPTVYTAGQTTAGGAGYAMAVAYTGDTTMDNQISIAEWEVSVAVGSVTGNVGGNVTGSVGSVLGNVAGSVASVVGNVDGNVLGSVANLLDISAAALARFFTRDSGSTYGASVPGSVVKEIAANAAIDPEAVADAVWDEPEAEHATAGTYGAAVPAIQAKTDTIGSVTIACNAPRLDIPSDALVIGRAYKQAYGNAITFTISNLSLSLLASGVTIEWRFEDVIKFTGTADTATTGHIDIAATDTDNELTPKRYTTEFVVLKDGEAISIQKFDKDVAVGESG